MRDDVRSSLIAHATAVRDRAYSRYSKFSVGAALLCEGDQIIGGCNVENASYGLTICAERAAVFTAIGLGFQRFTALAIASVGGVSPCGACRQVLVEFSSDLPILLVDVLRPGQIVETNLAQLLPSVFRL